MTPVTHAIRFDSNTGMLHVDGRAVPLTGIEKRIVSLLFEHLGKPITHQEIRTKAWGEGWSGGDEALRVAINRLRKKIEGNQRKPEIIMSVRGVGYRMIGYLPQ
jgi:two-component system KDP operon response regulator KdpE